MTIYRGPGGTGDTNAGEDVFGPNSSITNLTGIDGAIETPTYIRFDPNAGHTALQGDLTWNLDEGTLDVGLNGGAVTLQVGQEQHYRVLNQTGLSISNGTLVMYEGTDGNSGKLRITPWDGTSPTKTIMGITTEDIANGSNGYVTCFGKVRGIQTNGANYSETWADGDILYASSTGGLTKTLPQAPNSKTAVAVVVNSHVSNGALFVRVQHGSDLNEDELVQLTSLTNNDILQYDSTDGRFENRSLSAAGVQPTLVSGSNIKTINGESLLGSTNIPVTVAADIANMLETTDLGVTVQPYDIDTAKYDAVTANFTGTLQNGGSNVIVDTDIGSTVLAHDANLQSFVNTFTLPTVDGSTGFVLTTNGTGTLQFSAGGGGLADGDKGDITVSGGGTVWNIDAGVVTTTELGGDITIAGKALLDDATASDQRTTLGLGTIATQNAATVAITGGSITGITDLTIADGGTGASTAAAAFTNLKQAASDTDTGVVELATTAEIQTGTDTTRVITPAGYRATTLGWGQTWQNLTASRAVATTYTNSTGRPLQVIITTNTPGAGFGKILLSINSGTAFEVGFHYNGGGTTGGFTSFVVPSSSTYAVTFNYASGSGTTVSQWHELR